MSPILDNTKTDVLFLKRKSANIAIKLAFCLYVAVLFLFRLEILYIAIPM